MRSYLSSSRANLLRASITLAVLYIPLSIAEATGNYCYDMGGMTSLLKPGCIRVTMESAYDKMKGYGWLTPPENEVAAEDDLTTDELGYDGVTAARQLDFRADIPPGTYFVEVTVGPSPQATADLRVYANSALVAKSGRHVDADGSRPRRTLRFPLDVTAVSTTISVACDRGIELNGIVFKVPAYEPFRVEDGKLVSDVPVGYPVYARGKSLFDVGQYDMALKQFAYIPDGALLAYCKLVIGGRLDAENAKVLVRQAAQEFARYAGSEDPSMTNRFELMQKYLLGVYYYDLGARSYADERTGLTLRQRFTIAADLMEQIVADRRDPLYHQALWYLGRIWYWMWRDQNAGYQRREADRVFRRLAEDYPEFGLLSAYRGKMIAHPSPSSVEVAGAPSWAVDQHEALCRALEVIDYWVGVQTPDGEFGSGYERDSELVRWWALALLVADDARARGAVNKLADGIWGSGMLERGYCALVKDVRRSARLTSNLLPIMVATEYGNPLHIERCMETTKCMRDVWTGVNQRGHLHFRSAWFSATRCDERLPRAVDVPMNARAITPGRWLCWYNNNPNVTRLLADWGRSWVDDARRTDKDKPEGIVPAAVSFAEDEIGGYSGSWYRAGLRSEDYDWDFGGTVPIYDHLLATHDLTGDPELLYPIEKGLEMAQGFWKNPAQNTDEGSAGWAARLLDEAGFAVFGCKLRRLSRVSGFDDYLRNRGAPYTKFLLTGDRTFLVEACNDSINGTKYNFPLLTSEVRFTDTVSVRGVDDLLSMYTGGCGLSTEYPYYAVTWSNTTRDFAALVLNATRGSLRILAYNFEPFDRKVLLKLWRLEPGKYRLRIGPDVDGDGAHDLDFSEQALDVTERGTPVQVTLSARKLLLIEISQTERDEPLPPYLPDLALTGVDLAVDPMEPTVGNEVTVSVAVHNIGSARADRVTVVLEEGGERLGEAIIDSLDAPNDLNPRTARVAITWTPNLARTYHFKATVDPENAIQEINGLNNAVEFDLRVSS